MIGSYAYNDTKVDGGALQLANTPEHAASIWAQFRIPPNAQIGGGAFYQADRFGDVGNTVTLPSYVRFDTTAAYNVRLSGANMTAQLKPQERLR